MRFRLFQRDVFGNLLLIKRLMILAFGLVAQRRFKHINNTRIEGWKHIHNLPSKRVFFVSNHQTYFADVASMILAFASIKNGSKQTIGSLFSLFRPKVRIYFIAARETMKAGLLPKVFIYAGGILVTRTWREKGKDVNRERDKTDANNVSRALEDGWVITFPQGTTTPFMKGRKGTAHIIKENQPIVVPVVIDGFRRAFDKKGLLIKKKGVDISIKFKAPLEIDYQASDSIILDQVMDAIEQSDRFKGTLILEKENGAE